MQKIIDKIVELLKVKSLTTLSLVFTFCVLVLFKSPIPTELKELLFLVLGFYFGKGTNSKIE